MYRVTVKAHIDSGWIPLYSSKASSELEAQHKILDIMERCLITYEAGRVSDLWKAFIRAGNYMKVSGHIFVISQEKDNEP